MGNSVLEQNLRHEFTVYRAYARFLAWFPRLIFKLLLSLALNGFDVASFIELDLSAVLYFGSTLLTTCLELVQAYLLSILVATRVILEFPNHLVYGAHRHRILILGI